jgi:TRAP-type C4-dicarboxylate transport system permease small subunit
MSPFANLCDRADRGLAVIETVAIAALAMTGLGLGTMQVVLRYAFNTGFEWTEAYFILTTVTAMLMAGSRAVRDDAHVRVDVIKMVVPEATGRILDILAHSVSLALCAFYVWCGYLYVVFTKTMDTASPETGVKDWVVYSIMPSILILFCIRYVLRIRASWLNRDVSPHGDGVA